MVANESIAASSWMRVSIGGLGQTPQEERVKNMVFHDSVQAIVPTYLYMVNLSRFVVAKPFEDLIDFDCNEKNTYMCIECD